MKGLVWTAVGLATGNFIGAAILTHNFPAAIDRSFFQAVAVFASYLAVRRRLLEK